MVFAVVACCVVLFFLFLLVGFACWLLAFVASFACAVLSSVGIAGCRWRLLYAVRLLVVDWCWEEVLFADFVDC